MFCVGFVCFNWEYWFKASRSHKVLVNNISNLLISTVHFKPDIPLMSQRRQCVTRSIDRKNERNSCVSFAKSIPDGREK